MLDPATPLRNASTQWDVLRVTPNVIRAFEPGPDGLEVSCIGGRKPKGKDTERFPDFWVPGRSPKFVFVQPGTASRRSRTRASGEVLSPAVSVSLQRRTPHWIGAIDGPAEALAIFGPQGDDIHTH